MAKSKSVYVALERIIDDVSKDEQEILFKCMSKAMKKCKRDIAAASPDGPKGYKRSWAIRTKRYKYGFQGVVYNKDHPGLTHLLEKSHVIKNQYGTYGRTYEGHGQVVHIGPAAEAAEEYLIQLLVDAHEQA